MRSLARPAALVLLLIAGLASSACEMTPLEVHEQIVAGNQAEQRAMDRHKAAQGAAASMYLLLFLVLPLVVIAMVLALAAHDRN